MSRRRPLPALLAGLLAVAAAVAWAPAAQAEDPSVDEARRAFLRTRDARRLGDALRAAAPLDADTQVEAALAALAADGAAPAAPAAGRGYAALPPLVAQLRALDLAAAEASAAGLGEGALPFGVETWVRALLDVRRGRDEPAYARLGTWRAHSSAPERVAFTLALLGEALPAGDRTLLAGTGRVVLLRAALDGDLDAVARLAEALVALDPVVGADALCLALRALRRAGRGEDADRLLARPAADAAGRHACFRLERAIHDAWRGRAPLDPTRLEGLEGLEASPSRRAILEGLARTRGFPLAPAGLPVAVALEGRHAHALAGLATRLGRPTSPAEVEAAALAEHHRPSDEGFAARFLADRGFAVLTVAGGTETARRAADANVPFLLTILELEGDSFREEPVLVLGWDPASGLWLTSPADVERADVMAPATPAKARLLIAVPQARAAQLATWPPQGEREAGARIAEAVAAADAGSPTDALALLAPRSDASATDLPVTALYRAFFQHRRHEDALRRGDGASAAQALVAMGEALRRSRATAPTLAFEHLATYRSLAAAGRREAAVAALEAAEAAAPSSAWLPLTLYAVYRREGRRRDALEAIGRAWRAAPLDPSLLYHRARAARALGRDAEARADLVRALDRRPDWVPVGLELAHLELACRRPRAALGVLDALAGRVPSLATDDAAAVLRREAERRLVQVARTPADVAPFLSSPDAETRRRAAYRLADFEVDEAAARLRRLLDDPDAAVRITVLRVWMRPWLRARAASDPTCLPRVVGIVADDPAPQARAAAAALLGLFPGAEVARSLVDALEDVDVDVRRAAIHALLQIAGTDRGYDPEGSAEARSRAVAAWRAWLGS